MSGLLLWVVLSVIMDLSYYYYYYYYYFVGSKFCASLFGRKSLVSATTVQCGMFPIPPSPDVPCNQCI
jgi:hypothetical protein